MWVPKRRRQDDGAHESFVPSKAYHIPDETRTHILNGPQVRLGVQMAGIVNPKRHQESEVDAHPEWAPR